MPLPTRSIAVSAAIVGLFLVSIVGAIVGLSPFVCCKRALLAAIATYIVASFAVGTINSVLTRAMIASQIEKEKIGDV